MDNLRKAAEMALDALLKYPMTEGIAIQALRQALEQPEQEPVAWMYVNRDGECEQIEFGNPFDDSSVTPLYTAPPKREWVGLTDEEREYLWGITPIEEEDRFAFALAVESKLREKNGF